MRIAQISTLSAPVRRQTHGSIESHVWHLSRELTRLGHEVTVFGVAGSEVAGEFIATLPGPCGTPGSLDDWHLSEWMNLCRAIEQSARFDVLHSHAYMWGVPLQKFSRAPMLHTLHVMPDSSRADVWRMSGATYVTALSNHQWSGYPDLTPAAIIPHGVDFEDFTFSETPADYVCYLGRFTPGKGPKQAVSVARELGVKLVLAGYPNAYFIEHIQPLVDEQLIHYAGPVNIEQRNQLLGGARALLYPIQEPEPFGLVLAEAMLCGTPAAAIGAGAVPEIVEDGVTGYAVTEPSALPEAVTRCFALDRRRVRRRAEQLFALDRMTDEYVRLYERLAAGVDYECLGDRAASGR